MNLLCLNCGEVFAVEESVVGADGATVKCEHCGMEQPLFVRRRIAGLTDSANMRVSSDLMFAADSMVGGQKSDAPCPPKPGAAGQAVPVTSSFRKPMSSAWTGRRTSDTEPDINVGDVPPAFPEMPEVPGASDVAGSPAIDDGGFFVPDISLSVPDLPEPGPTGPFVVRSPAALVFEFPDFQTVDEWSRCIQTPEKYQVWDQSGTESNLGDFVRNGKGGDVRVNAIRTAMRTAVKTRGGSGMEEVDNVRDLDGMLRSDDRSATTGGVNAPKQFQFKIEERKESNPRTLILAVVAIAVGIIGVLAALFLLDLL